MAVFRVPKVSDYTLMANHHLRNTSLSLKAKGLLSLMLSLPENWDYTMKGLSSLFTDGEDRSPTAHAGPPRSRHESAGRPRRGHARTVRLRADAGGGRAGLFGRSLGSRRLARADVERRSGSHRSRFPESQQASRGADVSVDAVRVGLSRPHLFRCREGSVSRLRSLKR